MIAPTQDMVHGVDLSVQPNVTGAGLNSLVDNSSPAAGIGLVIWTTDVAGTPVVPDASTILKWQNYLWARVQPLTSTVTIYFWNPNGANVPTYLRWQTISIASLSAGTVTGTMIAANTITDSNVATVSNSKLIPSNGATAGQMLVVNGLVTGFNLISNIFGSTAAAAAIGSANASLSVNNAGNDLLWSPNQVITGISCAVCAAGGQVKVAHTLGVIPVRVNVTLQCIIADTGNTNYVVGQETNFDGLLGTYGIWIAKGFTADANYVYINWLTATTLTFWTIAGGLATPASLNNFKFKAYLYTNNV